MKEPKRNKRPVKWIYIGTIALCLVIGLIYTSNFEKLTDPETIISTSSSENIEIENLNDPNIIKEGIHLRTGLIDAKGLMLVVNNCTTCHSAKLVTQNRMGKEQWNATIRWMQEKQGLWNLGDNQDSIVDYLVANYPILEKGRRQALTNIDWYNLEE